MAMTLLKKLEIIEDIRANPHVQNVTLAKSYGITYPTVARIRAELGLPPKRGRRTHGDFKQRAAITLIAAGFTQSDIAVLFKSSRQSVSDLLDRSPEVAK